MTDDLFSHFELEQNSNELLSPVYRQNRSRKLNVREKQAINCLLDEDEKQDPEMNLSLLQELQRKNIQQNKRKVIQRHINRNLSPVPNRTIYPKMIKNHSMKQQPRKHFDLNKRTSIPYHRDFQQQTTPQYLLDQELQNQLKVHNMEQKYDNETLNSNQFNLKLTNSHARYQQSFVEELSQPFDIRGSKNLKIRQLLMKMKKQQNVANIRKQSNYQNQPIKQNEFSKFESLYDLKQRKFSKDLKYNTQSFDQSLYSTQVFYKERQRKQYKGKSPIKITLYKNGVKLKKIMEDSGTIKGTKLS